MKKKIGKLFAVLTTLAAACFSISLYFGLYTMFFISLTVLLCGIIAVIICWGKECKALLFDILEIILSW